MLKIGEIEMIEKIINMYSRLAGNLTAFRENYEKYIYEEYKDMLRNGKI